MNLEFKNIPPKKTQKFIIKVINRIYYRKFAKFAYQILKILIFDLMI